MAETIFSGPGFVVEDLTVATEGKVAPEVVFDFGPDPGASRVAQEVLRARFGRDLKLTSDLAIRSNGDVQLIEGKEAWRARLLRALATSRGELWWRPEYGVGVGDFLNRPASADTVTELQNRIRESVAADPAVDDVEIVKVQQTSDGLVEILVRVLLLGTSSETRLVVRRA